MTRTSFSVISFMYQLISRVEAKNKSLNHFYTGKLCVHGHRALRFVSTGTCTACDVMYRKSNSELVLRPHITIVSILRTQSSSNIRADFGGLSMARSPAVASRTLGFSSNSAAITRLKRRSRLETSVLRMAGHSQKLLFRSCRRWH